ncbi:unnamed protein product [Diatraea saccharalis]|uniref:LIM zinc-binding domain-containing protein n=1 Tax=Diatraea saccharalis TaxID=40085 RepID=A0A9N9RDP7_9NEOP|nr:unnamed protein product [Diatraea saccharalis]
MSRLDNMDTLEKQLADLQMATVTNTTGKMKKVPPAVPPKRKAQPQVPYSTLITNVQEPSYSKMISPLKHDSPSYNSPPENNRNAFYANINNFDVNPNHSQRCTNPMISVSRNVTYGNIPEFRRSDDDLPPPPPPPPSALILSQVKPYTSDQLNDNFIPPPSPVSSNYSELVRATANLSFNQDRSFLPTYQNEYADYGISQASTYESLYEPINPHPPSKNSKLLSNNSAPNYLNNNTPNSNKNLHKEEEVDALTNLLVQSITDSQDLDVFGICIKCNEKVIGEGSGCTAMGNMYHVKCFACYQCNVNLQGKTFHAVEGQPYCEKDYYESLEKCSVCNQPILDRILRATGNPYHPSCFTCIVCGKSLDGIPFTVDAMNQIHCIEDFHRKFAPRCCVCELPIMPENGEEETVRVVALDRSFHVRCYCCEDCGLLLSSEAEGRGCYPLDDHILCKECNAHRIRLLTNVMTTDL